MKKLILAVLLLGGGLHAQILRPILTGLNVSTGGGGGITEVCHVPLTGNGTGSITSDPVDCIGSNLVCFVAAGAAAVKVTTNVTVIDSTAPLNGYAPVANSLSAQNGDIGLFYQVGILGTTGVTFAMTGGNFSAGEALCVSGAMGVFDQGTNDYAANTGTASTIQPQAITPTQDNEIVVVACAGAENTISVTSGVTQQYNTTFAGGVAISVAIGYVVQTSATMIQPTCTAGSSAAGSLEAGIGSFQ